MLAIGGPQNDHWKRGQFTAPLAARCTERRLGIVDRPMYGCSRGLRLCSSSATHEAIADRTVGGKRHLESPKIVFHVQ